MGDEPNGDAGPASGARPEGSRRDPERTRVDLQRWLSTKLPSDAAPTVDDVRVPEMNGMSSETVLFDATWSEGSERATRQLVAPEIGW